MNNPHCKEYNEENHKSQFVAKTSNGTDTCSYEYADASTKWIMLYRELTPRNTITRIINNHTTTAATENGKPELKSNGEKAPNNI